MTDELMNQATEGMNAFEKVLHGVPGYHGYKEKELRRETDKTVREMISRQLMDQRQVERRPGRSGGRRPAFVAG